MPNHQNPQPNKLIPLLALILTVTLGFFGYSLLQKQKSHAEASDEMSDESQLVQVEKRLDAAETVMIPSYLPGAFLTYDYKEASQITLSGSNDKAHGLESTRTAHQAKLMIRMLRLWEGERVFHLSYHFENAQPPQNQTAERLHASFRSVDGSDIFITTDASGKLSRLTGQLDPRKFKFWTRTIERIGFQVPRTGVSSQWQMTEMYNNQPLVFSYSQSKESELNFQKVNEPGQGKKIAFEGSYIFDESEGYLIKSNLFESFESSLMDLVVRSTAMIEVAFLGQAFMSESEVSRLMDRFLKDRSQKNPDTGYVFDQRAMHLKELGDMGLADIFGLFNDQMQGNERKDAYFKVLAWAFLNPDKLDDLKEEMKTWGEAHEKLAVFSAALTNSGSDEAQGVLLELIDHFEEDKKSIASTLMNDLMINKSPSVDAERGLERIGSEGKNPEIRQQARYTLGAMANQLRKTGDPEDRERAERIRERSEQKLNQAKTPEDQAEALGTIGNIMSEKNLSSILSLIDSPHVTVRQEAVLALRGIPGEEAESAIIDVFLNDPSYPIRLMAVKSLGFRDPTSKGATALLKGLRKESEKKVRNKAYSVAVSRYGDFDPVITRQLLEEGIGREKDEKIIEQLEDALSDIEA
ncbi:MAG: hypothetical protein CMP10_00715 [Zetaproteobacteria bacterium]|nr:hypothetical protein [Pseudobdellovibrionaceae bacterium]